MIIDKTTDFTLIYLSPLPANIFQNTSLIKASPAPL